MRVCALLLLAGAYALAPSRQLSRRSILKGAPSIGAALIAAPGMASAAGSALENGKALPDGAAQSSQRVRLGRRPCRPRCFAM